MPKSKVILPPKTAIIPVGIDLSLIVAKAKLIKGPLACLCHYLVTCYWSQSKIDKIKRSLWHRKGYVLLNSKTLKRLIHNDYKPYIDALISEGYLEVLVGKTGKQSYYSAELAKRYKLTDKAYSGVKGQSYTKFLVKDQKALRRINRYNQWKFSIEKSLPLEEAHKLIYECIKKLWADINGFNHFMAEVEQQKIDAPMFKSSKEQRDLIVDRRFLEVINLTENEEENLPTLDRFGRRLHYFLTSCPKYQRSFFRFKDEPEEELISLDIGNCLPYLLGNLSEKAILTKIPEFSYLVFLVRSYTNEKDYLLYQKLCCEGQIYQFWMAERGIKEKAKVQKEFFKLMFGKERDISTAIKETFKKLFPSVYALIIEVKALTEAEIPIIKTIYTNENNEFVPSATYKNLACILQRLESSIVLEGICPKLIKQGIDVVTIHDCIVVKKKYELKARQIINEEFLQLEMQPPMVKTEIL